MVQKKPQLGHAAAATGKRPRGRPRRYDPTVALRQALETFWSLGYAATSLDDLSAATGMNRPSLYAAFGDKQALYLKALESYWDQALGAMRQLLSGEAPLADALMRVYDSALSLYFPAGGAPRGCFGISTAAVESVAEPRIRAAFENGLRRIDKEFERRIATAIEQGELPASADPGTLAEIASAILHTLAIRSRYGAARKELRRLAERAVMQMLQASPDHR
jgi:TetR/AcrR family transcriptional regulator, copper-responsive repressor